MKLDTSFYPHFYSAASATNRWPAVDMLVTSGPLNEGGDFVSPQRTQDAPILGTLV